MASRRVLSPSASSKRFACLIVIALSAGCATTQNVQQIDRLESVEENPRVILMPPDIRYYLLTAGGVPEPHAEWTEAARANFTTATDNFAKSIGTDLKIVDPDNMGETEVRYERLHATVGNAVITHHFGTMKLPTKSNGQVFDWSLGPEARALAEEHNADYALFVFYRDYQASGGRIAMGVLGTIAAAATGVGAGPAIGGGEFGFASLVDLQSGDIVWFNIVRGGSGEMRDETGAMLAVETLFRDFPTAKVTEVSE